MTVPYIFATATAGNIPASQLDANLAAVLPLTGGTVSGAVTFSSAITYGGVTFTNAVTGTGRPVLLARQMDENSAKDRRIADLELAANHSTRKVE